jgi:hypothetical protein
MTKERLQEILSDVWYREMSADEAFELIWLEKFESETKGTYSHLKALYSTTKELEDAITEAENMMAEWDKEDEMLKTK